MIPDNLREYPALTALEEADPAAVVEGGVHAGQVWLAIDPVRILPVCRFLKERQGFRRLSAVTAVDWFPDEPRFEVVHLLYSIERNFRLRLSCRLHGENPEIDSVTSLWPGANWYEREVFDLFGVVFRGHPDLRRIMMPEDWQGHPLRKDYPVAGFKYEYQNEK
ncbi:MAG TPA: NADH-quinone oxidoreductase subunit C [Bryobacteraceae bacterium]|nr:NADH-quinone oxidoreductase subunit C [Bryobacteraceae bacterium]